MCTKITGSTNAKYGYKIVVVHDEYCVESVLNFHSWIKGYNTATFYPFKFSDVLSLRKGRIIKDGVFHFFANLAQAKSVLHDKDEKDRCLHFAIIRCELVSRKRKGIHAGYGPLVDGKVAYVATKVIWDGKFIQKNWY